MHLLCRSPGDFQSLLPCIFSVGSSESRRYVATSVAVSATRSEKCATESTRAGDENMRAFRWAARTGPPSLAASHSSSTPLPSGISDDVRAFFGAILGTEDSSRFREALLRKQADRYPCTASEWITRDFAFWSGPEVAQILHVLADPDKKYEKILQGSGASTLADRREVARRMLWRLEERLSPAGVDGVEPHGGPAPGTSSSDPASRTNTTTADTPPTSTTTTRDLLKLARAYLCLRVREHDPNDLDVFRKLSPRLGDRVSQMTLEELRDTSELFRDVNFQDQNLFRRLGERFAALVLAPRSTLKSCSSSLAGAGGGGRVREPLASRKVARGAVMRYLQACVKLSIHGETPVRLAQFMGREIVLATPPGAGDGFLTAATFLLQLFSKYEREKVPEFDRLLDGLLAGLDARSATETTSGRRRPGTGATLGTLPIVALSHLFLPLCGNPGFLREKKEALLEKVIHLVGATDEAGADARSSVGASVRIRSQLELYELALRLEWPTALHTKFVRAILPIRIPSENTDLRRSRLPSARKWRMRPSPEDLTALKRDMREDETASAGEALEDDTTTSTSDGAPKAQQHRCNRSSTFHYQVAQALKDLGERRRTSEEKIGPFVMDLYLPDRKLLLEIDGPTHFRLDMEGGEPVYELRAKVKHRLLRKLGHHILHIPFFQWPRLKQERSRYLQKMLAHQVQLQIQAEGTKAKEDVEELRPLTAPEVEEIVGHAGADFAVLETGEVVTVENEDPLAGMSEADIENMFR